MERSAIPRRVSRVVHRVGDLIARANAVVIASILLITFIVIVAVEGFPNSWQTRFATISDAITLILLFVIQHTQQRQQTVLQLKLDELIRTSPNADDLLVHLEVADDNELIEREQSQVAHHASLRELRDVDV